MTNSIDQVPPENEPQEESTSLGRNHDSSNEGTTGRNPMTVMEVSNDGAEQGAANVTASFTDNRTEPRGGSHNVTNNNSNVTPIDTSFHPMDEIDDDDAGVPNEGQSNMHNQNQIDSFQSPSEFLNQSAHFTVGNVSQDLSSSTSSSVRTLIQGLIRMLSLSFVGVTAMSYFTSAGTLLENSGLNDSISLDQGASFISSLAASTIGTPIIVESLSPTALFGYILGVLISYLIVIFQWTVKWLGGISFIAGIIFKLYRYFMNRSNQKIVTVLKRIGFQDGEARAMLSSLHIDSIIALVGISSTSYKLALTQEGISPVRHKQLEDGLV